MGGRGASGYGELTFLGPILGVQRDDRDLSSLLGRHRHYTKWTEQIRLSSEAVLLNIRRTFRSIYRIRRPIPAITIPIVIVSLIEHHRHTRTRRRRRSMERQRLERPIRCRRRRSPDAAQTEDARERGRGDGRREGGRTIRGRHRSCVGEIARVACGRGLAKAREASEQRIYGRERAEDAQLIRISSLRRHSRRRRTTERASRTSEGRSGTGSGPKGAKGVVGSGMGASKQERSPSSSSARPKTRRTAGELPILHHMILSGWRRVDSPC